MSIDSIEAPTSTTSAQIESSYSPFHGFWQSFVTIGSCNHLIELFQRMSATQRKVRSREDVKLDNQLWGVKRTLSYFLLVATNKTIHSPTRQGLLFLVVKIL